MLKGSSSLYSSSSRATQKENISRWLQQKMYLQGTVKDKCSLELITNSKREGHIHCLIFFVFQVGLISGTAFMLIGLTVLVVGFLVPPKIEALGKDDFVVVDTRAIQFNGSLDICKLAGAILFCIGGTAMSACLLMSAFAKSYSKEEKYLQQRFKERIADVKAHATPVTKAPAPGESKIPVTLSKVQNVQPLPET